MQERLFDFDSSPNPSCSINFADPVDDDPPAALADSAAPPPPRMAPDARRTVSGFGAAAVTARRGARSTNDLDAYVNEVYVPGPPPADAAPDIVERYNEEHARTYQVWRDGISRRVSQHEVDRTQRTAEGCARPVRPRTRTPSLSSGQPQPLQQPSPPAQSQTFAARNASAHPAQPARPPAIDKIPDRRPGFGRSTSHSSSLSDHRRHSSGSASDRSIVIRLSHKSSPHSATPASVSNSSLSSLASNEDRLLPATTPPASFSSPRLPKQSSSTAPEPYTRPINTLPMSAPQKSGSQEIERLDQRATRNGRPDLPRSTRVKSIDPSAGRTHHNSTADRKHGKSMWKRVFTGTKQQT